MSAFYYRSILFSKETENVYNAWGVDKINNIRMEIITWDKTSHMKERDDVYISTIKELYGSRYLLCEYHKNQIDLGIYDAKSDSFISSKISDITSMGDSYTRDIAKRINKIAAAIERGEKNPKTHNMKDAIYDKWLEYRQLIKDSPIEKVDSTLDAKYIIEKDRLIRTDDELKNTLKGKYPHYKEDSPLEK